MPKMWCQLLLLSQKLDIVVLKPTAAEIDHQLHRRFRQRFTVSPSAGDVWLRYLKINHPAYADVELDETRLQILSDNDSILHLLPTVADTFPASTTSSASQTSAEDDTEFEDDILDMIMSDLIITVIDSELL